MLINCPPLSINSIYEIRDISKHNQSKYQYPNSVHLMGIKEIRTMVPGVLVGQIMPVNHDVQEEVLEIQVGDVEIQEEMQGTLELQV